MVRRDWLRELVPPYSLLLLALQQIADLDEQFLILGYRRRGRGFLLRPHDPAQELHDEEEEGEGQDKEIHHVAKERPL